MHPLDSAAAQLGELQASPAMFQEIADTIRFVLGNPEAYPLVRDSVISRGIATEEQLPVEFNPQFLMALLQTVEAIAERIPNPEPEELSPLRAMGRGSDSELVHVNPMEKEILRRMGGSGAVNPNTGLEEFKGGGGLFKAVLPIALSFIAPGIGTAIGSALGATGTAASMLGGAILGGTTSLITGGNPLMGALGGGLGGAFGGGMGDSLGDGITGGMEGGFGEAFGDKLTSGMSNAFGEVAGTAGETLGSGISGGLETAFGGVDGAFNAAGDLIQAPVEIAAGYSPADLGSGIDGAINMDPSWSDTINSGIQGVKSSYTELPSELRSTISAGKNVLGLANKAGQIYQALNPPDPRQFSRQNTQQQMQQLGGLNTSRAFGLGGTQSRGYGQMANVGTRFRNGGLAHFNMKGY